MIARLIALLIAAVVTVTGATARADDLRPPSLDSDIARREEAERRFRRGAELYKEGDLTAALVEFKRAYELVPTYKILYNLGQVSYERHDYAGALRYFREYLREGTDAVRPERRRDLADEIARLEQRVGKLDIRGVEPGLEILIDDTSVGTAPLPEPVAVNEGRRKIEIVGRAGEHRSRLVDVPGGELVRVSFAAAADARLDPRDLPQPAAPPAPAKALVASAPVDSPPAARPAPSGGVPWLSWTTTALLGAGAAATGTLAWTHDRDLQHQLDVSYPANANAIADMQRQTRTLAYATDGLLAATLVMAAISIYLTARTPSPAPSHTEHAGP
jgi:tetratricopeptide (TPR) repeat protein